MQQTHAPRGLWPRFRAFLFGERDAVATQLADIARQGSGMARIAHACAFLLVILFSAGSLVALSGDALAAVIVGWRHGTIDVPSAISIGVSTLLVVAMDTGMLYAASVLRILNTRRAAANEKRIHIAVMTVVAALEAGTYAFMSARYEHPSGLAIWSLILARAGAAPLLAVYLSMARPLPVTPRDILAQVELASGAGVLRDVLTIASDTTAPLARKIALFESAAQMHAEDRARLVHMLDVAQEPARRVEEHPTTRTPETPETPDRPPTGPGAPMARANTRTNSQGTPAPKVLHFANDARDDERVAGAAQGRSGRSSSGAGRTPGRTPGRTRQKPRSPEEIEQAVRAVWQPGMTVTQLERAAGLRSRSTAYRWWGRLTKEPAEQVAQ